MNKTTIVKKKLRKYESRDQLNDYILRIEARNDIVIDVIQFEWHSAPCYDRQGNFHTIHGLKVPVRYAWDAIDLYGKPDKAICADGGTFWIMGTKHDMTTGKLISLSGGNSSPFTVLTRETPIIFDEVENS